jgi:hypothetical protein
MGFSLGDTYKFADLNLGWDKRNDNSNDEFYWETVSDAVIRPALKALSRLHRGTDKVLLSGDCATDERFQRIVREVVDQKIEQQTRDL